AVERDRLFQRLAPGAVGDEDVSGGAAQVGRADLLELVLAVEVPEQQIDLLAAEHDELLVHLDADAAVVLVRADAPDVARHHSRVAHREGTAPADLLLTPRAPSAARGSARTPRTERLRLTCRSCSVFSSTRGWADPTPPAETAGPPGLTFNAARTFSA